MVSYILLYAVIMSLVIKLIESAFETQNGRLPEKEPADKEAMNNY